jgi:5S rRNA maturation endonuclease (ribonuclease M5)
MSATESRVDHLLGKIENAGCRVIVTRDGARCQCPAHEDANPSLSVSVSDDKVLVHCHAGCTTEDVLAAVGWQISDLFPDERGNGHSNFVATYGYVDENGVLLFEVVRRSDKTFPQRRPDGRGGWVWKLGDTRRVLYRLPQVIAAVAAGERIYVVEGEKDVHALERAGVVATCNPGGAKKWRDEYSDTLRGATVVIVADRDEAGSEHARTVRASLLTRGANVTIVQSAVDKKGADSFDHFAAGHGLHEFVPVTSEGDAARASEGDTARALASLLALDTLDPPLAVTAASIIGDGADAAAYVTLSDGSELHFRSLREMTQPGKLMAEIVATTAAMPKLNQQAAMAAVSLLKRYARHVRSMSEMDEAIEWGVSFLQAADVLDVDVHDQADRWAAFSKLSEIDPRRTHRESNISIAAASLVLRCVDGTRLVRTDWMRAYVRSIEPRVSPVLLAKLMQRVGWVRRGNEGRWKATRPGLPGQLNWAFWIVPPGWEDRGGGPSPAEAVTAGKEQPPAPARAPARAPAGAVTSRNADDDKGRSRKPQPLAAVPRTRYGDDSEA